MYIIELLIKKIFKKTNGFIKQQTQEEIEETRCNHVFMPIDSTGEILACKNCGAIVHKNKLKKAPDKF